MKSITLPALYWFFISTCIFYAGCSKTSTPLINPQAVVSTFESNFTNPQGIVATGTGSLYAQDTIGTFKFSPDNMVSQMYLSPNKFPFGIAAGNDFIYIVGPGPEIIITDSEATSFFATGTTFNNPFGLAADNNGNIYVTDQGTNQVSRITAQGVTSILAGSGNQGSTDGTGAGASFNKPAGIAVDGNGNVYVADNGNNKIRKISSIGIVTTLAGTGNAGSEDGNGNTASFNSPVGIAVDAGGNVFVADRDNNKIRKITANGMVSTLAGTGSIGSANGNGNLASFNHPTGIAIDNKGNLYVTDNGNNKIRMIVPVN
jgi:sugar lactone lactonase YvrE